MKTKFLSSLIALTMLTGCSFTSAGKKYEVMWFSKNSDGVLQLLQRDTDVADGTTPEYRGETPKKDDLEYTRFIFERWDPTPAPIHSNMEYYAVYRSEDIVFNVNWRNYDGSIIETTQVKRGFEPEYTGATPTREKDAANTYSFVGWASKEDGPVLSYLPAVYKETDYYAKYTSTLNSYTVRWVNYDNTPLVEEETYEYGSMPTYKGEEPYREGNEIIDNFPFIGWDKEIEAVKGDVTYKAVFDLFEDPISMFSFQAVEGGYSITGFSNAKLKESVKKLAIPSSYNNQPVIDIAQGAFNTTKKLESVIIPGSVKTIGNSAFGYCHNIASVTLSEGLTSLGSNAFIQCELIEKLTIPSTVTTFGKNIFNYAKIKELSMPFIGYAKDNLCTLSDLGINQSYLEKLTLLEGCEGIAYDAFKFNGDLFLPASLTSLGGGLKAKNVYFAGGVSDWASLNITTDNTFNALYCKDILVDELVVSGSITEIKDYTFSGIASITSVTVGGVVSKVGKYAFHNCANINKVFLGDSVKEVEQYAFHSTAIESLRLPKALTKVGSGAFKSEKLVGIYYDGTLNDYLDIDFAGPLFASAANQEKLYFLDENGDVSYLGKTYSKLVNLVLPDGLETVKKYQFYSFKQLATITFNDDLKNVEDYAFYHCSVNSITLPASVTTIGNGSFSSFGLTYFSAVGLTSIGSALDNSTYLNTIVLGAIDTIDSRSFSTNSRLNTIIINNSEKYTTNDGVVYSKDGTELIYCPRAKSGSFTVPEGVTTIKASAFENCQSLAEITLPNTLTTIETIAFKNCTGLLDLTIPDTVTSIGEKAFENLKLTNITLPFIGSDQGDPRAFVYLFGTGGTVINITLTEKCLDLHKSALSCGSIQTVYLPDSLKDVPSGLLANCPSLKSIDIPFTGVSRRSGEYFTYIFGAPNGNATADYTPKTLKEINIRHGEYLQDYAFYNLKYVEKITLPDEIISIGANAFKSCIALKELTIPFINSTPDGENGFIGYLFGETDARYNNSGVPSTLKKLTIGTQTTVIPTNCLAYLKNLEEINLPSTLTEIKSKGFYDNDGLLSLNIPDSVTKIGESAFEGCNNITTLNTGNGLTALSSNVFKSLSSLKTLTIGRSVQTISSNSFGDIQALKNFQVLNWNATSATEYKNNEQSYWPLYRCATITEINFGDNVTRVPRYFAWSNTALKTVRFGASTTYIGKFAFYNCTSLTTIIYNNTSSEWSLIEKGDYWHDSVPSTTMVKCTDNKYIALS